MSNPVEAFGGILEYRRMTLTRLSLLVTVLLGAISLAWTNPTLEDYLYFVEQEMDRALDRMDRHAPAQEQKFLRQVFRAQSKRLLESHVRPRTTRGNWGIFSRYTTRVADSEVIVIGIAGRFIPIKGLDEAILRIGRMVF